MAKRACGGSRQQRFAQQVSPDSSPAQNETCGGSRQQRFAQQVPVAKPNWLSKERAMDNSRDEVSQLDQDMYRDHLKKLFVHNKLSSKDLQKTVHLSSKAGCQGSRDLGTAGHEDRNPGSIHRDLKRKIVKSSPMPQEYMAEIPVWDKHNSRQMLAWIPILLLHEVLFWLTDNGRITTDTVCTNVLPQNSGQFASAKSFCLEYVLALGLLICIWFHGDGVPMAKGQSVEVFSWNFSAAPSKERVLFCFMEKAFICACGCGGRHALNALIQVLAWSFNSLLAGKNNTEA